MTATSCGLSSVHNPKPSRLLTKLLASYRNTKDSVFLDFFSGSATTAHAVMLLNALDNGNRKFIMIQFPELTYTYDEDGNEIPKKTDGSKAAFAAGYRSICEIGKERIRRAAKKIHEDYLEAVFDDGFKVFEVGKTTIRWNLMVDDELLELEKLQVIRNYLTLPMFTMILI